jgi:hypothetical protein
VSVVKTFLISDAHGDFEGLRRSLLASGLIDRHGNRQLARRHRIFSIGDLANCVEESHDGDLACLDLVGKVIDGMLLGNHEWPYIHEEDIPFAGFHRHQRVGEMIRSIYDRGLMEPFLLLGETLVTHAGVSRHFAAHMSVSQVSDILLDHWRRRNWNFSWFSSVGHARGGRHSCGGMLWCDFDREFRGADFFQIVGHTPGKIRMREGALCIDVGAKGGAEDPFVLEVAA